jgi:ribosome maturation factor RimP
LRNLEEIKNNIGKYINVKTYEKIMVGKTGIKEFEGHLLNVEDDLITMNFKMKQFKKEITIPYEKIAKIRLAIEF